MSRLSATTRSAGTHHDGRIGALHRQGDKWRLVVIDHDNNKRRIVHAESIRFGDVAAARAAIARHKVDRLIRVAPAARTVCRLVEIPSGSPAEMAGAAELLAEAQLPGSAPAHRRGAGVIGGSPGPGKRNAMIIAWLGENDEPVIDLSRESWTSEIAAIAALAPGGTPGGGGQALYADRTGGSIAVYAVNGSVSVARTMREQDADTSEWASIIGHAIDETRAALGSAIDLGDEFSSDTTSVGLSEEARRAILDEFSAAVRGDRWLDEFGVALGAALGAGSTDAASAGLFALSGDARRLRRSPLARGIEWLSDPAHAIGLAVGAVALALLLPIGMNALRVAVLNSKLESIDRQLAGRESAQELDKRSAFLNELVQRRWPMTKLLSDLAGSLPVGMVVESVTMDRGTRVQVRGEVDSLELANKSVAMLNSSGVFTNAQLMQTRSLPSGKLEYRVEAEVSRPFATARGIEDFGQDTLAVRLYGERARGYTRPAGAVASGDDTGSDSGTSGGSSRSRTRDRSSGPTFTGEAPARDDAPEIPPALTDADIAALSKLDAMREVAKRSRAATGAATEEDRTRLQDEVKRLREHARNAGGGA